MKGEASAVEEEEEDDEEKKRQDPHLEADQAIVWSAMPLVASDSIAHHQDSED
jgi:hypothetical protein